MTQTILVVDDDPKFLDVISDVLSEEGYQVRRAADGHVALQEIETAAPDLVLSDVVMPRLDGFALAERIASQPHPTPVILMSGTGAAPRRGRPPVITKPFDLDDLLTLVARVLADHPGLRPACGNQVR